MLTGKTWRGSPKLSVMAVRSFVPLISACFLIIIIIPVLSIPALLGIHPLDEKYFVSESIECKDGSKSFSRDRINDDFCDCVDGTDEPGTSACPLGKFYCRNVGSTPRFLFSSRVNDQICDCCDGSDEYDGSVNCLNTCIMGGNVLYKMGTYSTKVSTLGSVDAKETKSNALEDVIQKLKGLKLVLILQLVLIILLVALWLFQRRRIRSKRRRYR